MSNNFNDLISISEPKKLVKDFNTLINKKINRIKFLQIAHGNSSVSWLNTQSNLITNKAKQFAPDSSFANKRNNATNSTSKQRQHGKLINEIKQTTTISTQGIRNSITLNKEIKGYQRGIYFSIIRGYRKNQEGKKIKYKYSKRGARTNLFNRGFRVVLGNNNNFVKRYIHEVFVPEFNKEK
ncbi:hypothetical protein MBVG596_0379 [Mycoplasmopsis bovigenitalium]|uniref:hypothetical protein n=1 Tax=Mycoplasmopsis bovigenitalium TaxID=2112 RepID=UPI00090A84DC|nr:hypothetical protein [Mycoplasmopsis bovigenitalium]BAW18187.1 hypothetical protein MBVG596_0379 [Mycoplasmopsis bovigenitalium]